MNICSPACISSWEFRLDAVLLNDFWYYKKKIRVVIIQLIKPTTEKEKKSYLFCVCLFWITSSETAKKQFTARSSGYS